MYRINIDTDIESHKGGEIRQDGMLGLGISIGLHAAGLLFVLLLTALPASHGTLDTPFVTVHLVESAANGTSTAEPEPFPGMENEKAPKAAAGSGDVIRPPRPVIFRTRPVKEQKLRKDGKRRRPVNISGKTSEPEPETASVPAPSDTSASRDPAPSQIGESAGDAGGSGSGPDVQGTFESGSGNGLGNGSGKGSGNGLEKGSGDGGASAGKGGRGGEFSLKQVDQPPVPVQKVEPEFPPAARRLGAAGKVMVKFLVKANGSVINASILEADPEGLFDQSALEAIVKWRFTPGIYQGKAVATWVMLPVHFRLTR